uniref:Leucyl aminopeptidase n=1 Tax=Spirometra erinaceieuropaei TaxID=99802 RepID=A0A0F6MV46_SPIER|nr:leucyl aminopeptidase [Spirometra erinaceieuropaei]
MWIVAFLVALAAFATAAEPEIKIENDFSNEYQVVVFINDVGTGLGKELAPIERAIAGYNQIDPRAGSTLTVIPFPHHMSRKLIFSSTGSLMDDLKDSRDIYKAAHAAFERCHSLNLKKILLVVGPFKTALSDFAWAQGIYPKITAALGALHALYVPLQVRGETDLKQKFDVLGLYGYDEKLRDAIVALAKGEAVYRDIGDSDSERMAAPKIAEYLEQRKTEWEKSHITMEIMPVNETRHPLAYAVSRAAEDYEPHKGKVVYLTYTPEGNVDETVLLVGKGITIDTGGADLKVDGIMYGMHTDKMGGSMVAGFFEILSHLKPKGLKVYGYMAFVRNSIGKNAFLSDEIPITCGGLRVRIGDTDAEGRMGMSDILYEARAQALKSVNPRIFTLVTLTGSASRAFGPITVSMDNGPARLLNMAQSLSDAGDLIADPSEVARIRYEDFEVNYPISDWEDVMQFNDKPGATSSRGFSFPMGFMSITSELDKHGVASEHPIPYTHSDIAGSAGGIDTLATGSPLRMYANRFILPRFL